MKYLDLGFLGFEKEYPGSKVLMPKKKPIRKELTEEEKEANKTKKLIDHPCEY